MAALLALVSAACFGFGTVLQQREAMGQSREQAASAGILLRLARRPIWLAGFAAYCVGYGLQAAALGIGRLVVVQPVLATSIVFALPFGVWLSAQRISRRDAVAAVVVTLALGLFLLLSDPAGGRDDAPLGAWLVAGGAAIGVAFGLAAFGLRRAGAMRAALLGTAAGLLFALVSALTKGAVEVLSADGVVAVLGDWHVYVLVVIGFAGMTLTQISLQAGVLPPAIASTSITNPAVSVVFGVSLFDEKIHESALGTAASVAALAVMLGGIAVLALGSPRPDPARLAGASAPASG